MVDVFPPNYATDVGRVRKHIPDIVQYPDPADPLSEPAYLWDDDAIQSFIDDEKTFLDGNPTLPLVVLRSGIWRAAARVLAATANNEALVSKKIVTEDLATDGPAVARALLAAAKDLEARADKFDEETAYAEVFYVVPYVHTPPRVDFR